MPYFIYQITQEKQLQCIDIVENYRDARSRVRQLRSEQASDDASLIRLIHASNELQAERLLLTQREVPVEGDD